MLPTDRTDKIDPADPMDRIDPADPTDRIDPADPMERMDPALASDSWQPAERIDRSEDAERIERSLSLLSQDRRESRDRPLLLAAEASPARRVGMATIAGWYRRRKLGPD